MGVGIFVLSYYLALYKICSVNDIKSKGIPVNGGIDKLDSVVEYNPSHYRKEAGRIYIPGSDASTFNIHNYYEILM